MKIYITIALTFFLISCSSVSVGTGARVNEGTISHSAGGIIFGGSIGSDNPLDPSTRQLLQEKAPITLDHLDKGDPLTLQDIKNMSAVGIANPVIIHYIQASHSSYHLSSSDIQDLIDAKVSSTVIDAMIDTRISP